MTKAEAMLAIDKARCANGTYHESKLAIDHIIDQIDQSPAEFTVRELCELIATSTVDYVVLDGLLSAAIEFRSTREVVSIDSLRAKLLELAKPPEPQTVLVEMPLEMALTIRNIGAGEIAKVCKAALEKAGVKL